MSDSKEISPAPAPILRPITEKVLASGLVDEATARMMEMWGYLPQGASEKVNEEALKNATREKVTELAKSLADEIEKEHALRETYLDLDRLKFPAAVRLSVPSDMATKKNVVMPIAHLDAMMDRMGRFYFRIQDVDPDWFIPGFHISRHLPNGSQETLRIYQSQVLFHGQQGICVQVSTEPLKSE